MHELFCSPDAAMAGTQEATPNAAVA